MSTKEIPDPNKNGMYGDTPKIRIGRFSICEMTIPAGDEIWVEDEDLESGGDAACFPKALFEPAIKEVYDKNF